MAAINNPQTMSAWETSSPGPLDKVLRLREDAPYPSQPLNDGQVLVRVAAASLNPADYKVFQLGFAAKAILKFPKTVGMDLSGHVVAVGPSSQLKPGDRVLGRVNPLLAPGALSQFVVLDRDGCAAVGDKVSLEHAAGVGTAALTAYQTIVPNVKEGSRVFLNGGTGGTGTFAIQIAKAVGCHVTVSCSTKKVDLCKQLGADSVIDYKTTNLVEHLTEQGPVYDLAVDFVGTPTNLYKATDHFLKPGVGAKFVMVAGSPSLASVASNARNVLLPAFLGGGKHKFEVYLTKNNHQELAQIAKWMEEGKVKTIVHSVFDFKQVPQAFEELKSGGATGKIIVRVGEPEA
jgi:NADPH:quinone reductase-like Zn-dependent oxidoreductase